MIAPPHGGERRRDGFPNREEGTGPRVENMAEVLFMFADGELGAAGSGNRSTHFDGEKQRIKIAQARKAARREGGKRHFA